MSRIARPRRPVVVCVAAADVFPRVERAQKRCYLVDLVLAEHERTAAGRRCSGGGVEGVGGVERHGILEGLGAVVVEERRSVRGLDQRRRVRGQVPLIGRERLGASLRPLPQTSARATTTAGMTPKPPSKGALKPDRQAGAFARRLVPVAKLRFTPPRERCGRAGVVVAEITTACAIARGSALEQRLAVFDVLVREKKEADFDFLLATEGELERFHCFELLVSRQAEIDPWVPGRALREVLDHGAFGEALERAVVRRAIARPAGGMGPAKPRLRLERMPESECMGRAAQHPGLVETVDVLQEKRMVPQKVSHFDRLQLRHAGAGQEQRVVAPESPDEPGVDREVVARGWHVAQVRPLPSKVSSMNSWRPFSMSSGSLSAPRPRHSSEWPRCRP